LSKGKRTENLLKKIKNKSLKNLLTKHSKGAIIKAQGKGKVKSPSRKKNLKKVKKKT